MILGMPVAAWVLLVFAVGSGLAIEVAFYLGRRRERDEAER